MKCPACKEVNLVMADRQGIEIDYCPECRGIWLDRGELDKIIERSASQQQIPSRGREADHVRAQDRGKAEYYPKKKKSLLSELFDF
ncbi:MAG: hypothetical protein C4548_14910 [Desulfobacteraceae bacterium]|jgi:Zn-finger nucleic acid-binding protein|nr:MAG: hypothetical protein C4548_14910 [Desulfobacteraceae bacterium]